MKNNILITLSLIGVISGCGISPIIDSEKKEDTSSLEDTGEIIRETGNAEDTADTAIEIDPDLLTDFFLSGPYEISTQSRSASVTNCDSMSYTIYSPQGAVDPPVAVLGHGFARGSGVMTGWAEHLSSWGVEVLLPTLCHYNVWLGVDHEMNGQNMVELASLHNANKVVYAGHSAGGLAAVIAASQDNNAAGVLGLDVTDTEDIPGVPDFIGQEYAGSVTLPAFSIIGEPSSCNMNNNGIELFRMMKNYQIIKIVSSDHCDFENPTDAVCELSCENSTVLFGDSEIKSVITPLGTAAIMSLTELSEDGSLLWSIGLDNWTAEGIVQKLD